MSKFSDMIRDSKLEIVLPVAGDLVYSSVGTKDLAVCFTVTTCYIECDNLDLCVMFIEYLKRVTKVKELGTLNKVLCLNGAVYRQRLIFSRFIDIIKIASKFCIGISISRNFRLHDSNLSYIRNAVTALRCYYDLRPKGVKELDFYAWLTYCLTLNIWVLCREYGIPICIANFKEMDLGTGLLFRVPFLSGTCSRNHRRTSILLLGLNESKVSSKHTKLLALLRQFPSENIKKNEKTDFNGYRIKFSKQVLHISGFTLLNVKKDVFNGIIELDTNVISDVGSGV